MKDCHCIGQVYHYTILPVLGKRNNSPGQDSITTEFNQVFWPTLGNLLVTVFNESHELGSLPESQRNSVMSLIFKKDDDEVIANYRPISLTNVDYRILAFTLAQRMQNIMKNIVNTDQSAYIKGRYMGTNIRLVDDVIKYYELASKSGILFMLVSQITVLRYGVALVNGCGLKQWYIMY